MLLRFTFRAACHVVELGIAGNVVQKKLAYVTHHGRACLWHLHTPTPTGSHPNVCCCDQWRAAGVLVYEFDKHGEMQLLLARQDHSDQKGSKSGRTRHRAWNLLGMRFCLFIMV